jgi:predicted nucleic acid-binding protein
MTKIVNIRKIIPHHTDKFFVDTNVWFWITYASSNEMFRSSANWRYQSEAYPQFIEKILDEGATLYHCPLTFSELANVIERTEYELAYPEQDITRKDFRCIPEKRVKVLNEIEEAWENIKSMSTCLDIKLTSEYVEKSFGFLKVSRLDSYDAFYCELMQRENIVKLITDDSDFSDVKEKHIYTANNKVLQT